MHCLQNGSPDPAQPWLSALRETNVRLRGAGWAASGLGGSVCRCWALGWPTHWDRPGPPMAVLPHASPCGPQLHLARHSAQK